MPSRASLQWDGDKLIEQIVEAARRGVNDVLDDTDTVASNSHWWVNRTGYGEAHIETEPAKVEGSTVAGKVGATYGHGVKGVRSAFYLLFLEYKTPFLRPAGDVTFPTLPARIERRFHGGS